jgi:hypothetical protein
VGEGAVEGAFAVGDGEGGAHAVVDWDQATIAPWPRTGAGPPAPR